MDRKIVEAAKKRALETRETALVRAGAGGGIRAGAGGGIRAGAGGGIRN